MLPEDIIYNTAIGDGLPSSLALLLVAQAQHESGNFTSNIYLTGNNAFGYSYVQGARWQLPDPGNIADNGQPSARYANLEDSTHELTSWLRRRQRDGIFPTNLSVITLPEQYALLLKKAGYYGDSLQNYANGLIRWFGQYKGKVAAITGGSIFFFLILFLLFIKK